MKNHSSEVLTPAIAASSIGVTSLFQLVKKLQTSLVPAAAHKRSFIINAIDKSVAVFAEESTLAYVMGSLLSNAVYKTSDCCIRIETENTDGQLQIRIHNQGKYAYSSYTHCLSKYAAIARQSGWDIGLETENRKGITVVFSMAQNIA